MGNGHLNVLPLQVDDRIERFRLQILFKQVFQTIAGEIFMAVEFNRQPGIQKGIILDQVDDVVADKPVIFEYWPIGLESDDGPVHLIGLLQQLLLYLSAFAVAKFPGLPLPDRPDNKVRGKGIHRLDTYSVKTHRFLENLGIIFGARIHLAHRFREFSQRNAPAIIAYPHNFGIDDDFDFFPEAHHKLIHGIVQDFFHQHVNPVVRCRSVTQFADIHSGPLPYMLLPVKGKDGALIINCIHLLEFSANIAKSEADSGNK